MSNEQQLRDRIVEAALALSDWREDDDPHQYHYSALHDRLDAAVEAYRGQQHGLPVHDLAPKDASGKDSYPQERLVSCLSPELGAPCEEQGKGVLEWCGGCDPSPVFPVPYVDGLETFVRSVLGKFPAMTDAEAADAAGRIAARVFREQGADRREDGLQP